jgi:hypothetical protein
VAHRDGRRACRGRGVRRRCAAPLPVLRHASSVCRMD